MYKDEAFQFWQLLKLPFLERCFILQEVERPRNSIFLGLNCSPLRKVRKWSSYSIGIWQVSARFSPTQHYLLPGWLDRDPWVFGVLKMVSALIMLQSMMCHVLGVEKKTFSIWWTQHCLWNPATVQNVSLQFMVSRDFFWFRMNLSHGVIHGFYPHHSMTCQLDRWCCPKKVSESIFLRETRATFEPRNIIWLGWFMEE